MRVEPDENVPTGAAALFAQFGHEADTVAGERLAGVTDDAVAAVATAVDRLLVTFDLGFGDPRRHRPGTHAGIVLLRLKDQRLAGVLAVLRDLLAAHDLAAFFACTVVVTERLVRIRGPEP